ncbi:hypothetical protein HC028_13240 [Planosporangium flavigriseum]|uniref:hypothetical protein n=1 Tax=Planosporangium flavigriseum TaxID=373681 RepID=UPI0014397106|nr:hypothetical protein [Planosporangium flavigriseum]NJC65462.1 hypothetical protein [Planosporangium flavigriseum]
MGFFRAADAQKRSARSTTLLLSSLLLSSLLLSSATMKIEFAQAKIFEVLARGNRLAGAAVSGR